MAWIDPNSSFDPDSLGLPVIGIASYFTHHDSGDHYHQMGQLLFSQKGCMRLTIKQKLFILPPRRAIWIPPNTTHRVEIRETVNYRSIYFVRKNLTHCPAEMEVMEVNALFYALLERIANASFETNWDCGPGAHILAVCLDEMQSASRNFSYLPIPSDSRLTGVLSLHEQPPPLSLLACHVGASEKTIGRIFQRETGLNYQQWRQQWRFLRSIELLSKEEHISSIAQHLEFASDSAFIAFFKKMSGLTPGAYRADFTRKSSL